MNTFLTKISELFSKDILFASLLPGLLFLVCLSSLLVYIVGPVNALVLYGEQSTNSALLIAFLSVLALIMLSYVLHSVRDMILAFWCGKSFWHRVVLHGLQKWHKKRFDQLYSKSMVIGDWMFKVEEFNRQFDAVEREGLPDIPMNEKNTLMQIIGELKIPPSLGERQGILKRMSEACKKYNYASMIIVRQKFNDWDAKYRTDDAIFAAWLDTQYGSYYSIKATELGNIVQAYNEYSLKRYQMEAAVFWPRLQKVMDASYMDKVADQRISLDFALTCAMLSLVLFLMSLLGPFIYTYYPLWISMGIVSLILTLLCYRLAVDAASALGHLVRSSYDLYRLKLLNALNLKWPKDTDEEKAIWQTFSQSVTYGYSSKLELVDEKP